MEVAHEQGWDDESIGLQLLGFIQEHVPDFEGLLHAHFAAVAEEENADNEGEENDDDDDESDDFDELVMSYLIGDGKSEAPCLNREYWKAAHAGDASAEPSREDAIRAASNLIMQNDPAQTVRDLIDDLARVSVDDISERDLSASIITAFIALGYGDDSVVGNAQGRCEQMEPGYAAPIRMIPQHVADDLSAAAAKALEVFDGTSDSTDNDETIVMFCEEYGVSCDGDFAAQERIH